ncbi:U-box domain-containing protein 4 [Hibiscus syriacus]|uniref:RING-type E3 ubiquitin transferase n=1 Tax=Hibiscus syriacus TaxID=106335 RepID=A0A6A3AHQ9_HIBSY|nr:U-box domain-containing protein 4-like [Hibiscus syriacus]XP_039000761.1 U-box domain-containing protein 4-like [Hibiscus syriacus]KAE8704121.1 U-box domain-containing protein 4 [Hibiscus syriacus]
MEISLLKALLSNISSFLNLSSSENINSDPVQKYYQGAEEILKLLKPFLSSILDSEISSDEVLSKALEGLSLSIEELREQFESWQPLSSKVYFVLQVESLISKIRNSSLDMFQFLKSSHQHLPDKLRSASVEDCLQKIKHVAYEQASSVIREAIRDQVDSVGPSSDIIVKIAENLSLRSNQEILIEAVALEKLKENAEQAENTAEAEFIDQIIALVTRMHDRLLLMKQSATSSPVPIPTDFCCPLSLELMTDPVIVASGQTYERAFIKNWIGLGLTVCPKTRQTLTHTNLIPNYTVKALIANWCESNNVKLPNPMKSSLNQSYLLLVTAESGLPRDSNSFAPRSSQPLSPESRSRGQAGKNLVTSSGIHREGTSPLHPRSTSGGSMPGIAGNGESLDVARTSPNSSVDSSELEQRYNNSVCEPPVSASNNAGQSSQNHTRSVSASSALPNSDSPQGAVGDANETSETHLTAYNSDVSGEVKSDSQPTVSSVVSQREPEFPPRLVEARSRSQTIWRRPSERFIPRIVSSPGVENGADLSGIETQVKKLVDDLKSTSVDNQREATTQLRLLAKHNTDNRIIIANCGAITLLVDLLRSPDTKIQENTVTALLNLSINDNNKTAIADANAIEPLIHVLETGSPEAKENSAATLFSLSVIEDNKVKIGRSGAIEPLVDLLGNGTPRGKKDAATALFNLSIFHENKARIVQAGAVRHLVDLMDPAAGMVDKAVAVLANLATVPEGRNAIGQEGGIPVLVEVVELGSVRGKENAAAALLQLCTTSGRFCSMVLQEGAVPPLVALSQSGTPRAREKAQALLTYFRSQRHGSGGRG